MNYDNYERSIVERYGVELAGWPVGKIRSPGALGGRDNLTALYDALVAGSCHWRLLSLEELEQRIITNKARAKGGEKVYKARRARKSTAKSAEVLSSSEEEGSEEEGSDLD